MVDQKYCTGDLKMFAVYKYLKVFLRNVGTKNVRQ